MWCEAKKSAFVTRKQIKKAENIMIFGFFYFGNHENNILEDVVFIWGSGGAIRFFCLYRGIKVDRHTAQTCGYLF